jgi:5'-3' exonuclease
LAKVNLMAMFAQTRYIYGQGNKYKARVKLNNQPTNQRIKAMGIPSYFAHIVKRHRHIIKRHTAVGLVHNLYLDSNSLIYDAVYAPSATTEKLAEDDRIIQAVCDKIVEYVTILKPTNRLFITFDGVAPQAKMEQQRKRRFMTAYKERQEKQQSPPTTAKPFNTVCITPGTAFMRKLGLVIQERFTVPGYAAQLGLSQVLKISAADEVGEGEHKIFTYMRADPTYHHDTTTVVYGLDADLIMLGLLHNPVFLFRETPEFIKQLDRTLNPHELYMLDLPELARRLNEENTIQPGQVPGQIQGQIPGQVPGQVQAHVNDYTFLCFFLGNDFLPHFPALNIRTHGIDRLMQTYTKIGLPLITNNKSKKIHWKNVRQWLNDLATHEHAYILEEVAARDKQAKHLHERSKRPQKGPQQKGDRPSDPDENLPLEDRAMELYINPTAAGWESRYYSALFDVKIDDQRRREICVNYLEGLEWTWKYYTTGCVDWRWRYKYAYPPLLIDLLKFVPYFDVEFFSHASVAVGPVSPYVQLSYVLPRPYLHLLPPPLQQKLLQKHGDDWYPDPAYATFRWAFCKYFWEAHVLLPDVELFAIEQALRE